MMILGSACFSIAIFWSTWLDPFSGCFVIIALTIIFLIIFAILRTVSWSSGVKVIRVIEEFAPVTANFIKDAYRDTYHYFRYGDTAQVLSTLSSLLSVVLLANSLLCIAKIILVQNWQYLLTLSCSVLGYFFNTWTSQKFNYPFFWLVGIKPTENQMVQYFKTHYCLAACVATLANCVSSRIKEPYEAQIASILSRAARKKIYQRAAYLLPNYNRITERYAALTPALIPVRSALNNEAERYCKDDCDPLSDAWLLCE